MFSECRTWDLKGCMPKKMWFVVCCKLVSLYIHACDKMYQALPVLSGESLGTRLSNSTLSRFNVPLGMAALLFWQKMMLYTVATDIYVQEHGNTTYTYIKVQNIKVQKLFLRTERHLYERCTYVQAFSLYSTSSVVGHDLSILTHQQTSPIARYIKMVLMPLTCV